MNFKNIALIVGFLVGLVAFLYIYATADRNQDYNPSHAKGQAYMNFMVGPLKQFIDITYRTKTGRNDTAVAGSSMGG